MPESPAQEALRWVTELHDSACDDRWEGEDGVVECACGGLLHIRQLEQAHDELLERRLAE